MPRAPGWAGHTLHPRAARPQGRGAVDLLILKKFSFLRMPEILLGPVAGPGGLSLCARPCHGPSPEPASLESSTRSFCCIAVSPALTPGSPLSLPPLGTWGRGCSPAGAWSTSLAQWLCGAQPHRGRLLLRQGQASGLACSVPGAGALGEMRGLAQGCVSRWRRRSWSLCSAHWAVLGPGLLVREQRFSGLPKQPGPGSPDQRRAPEAAAVSEL